MSISNLELDARTTTLTTSVANATKVITLMKTISVPKDPSLVVPTTPIMLIVPNVLMMLLRVDTWNGTTIPLILMPREPISTPVKIVVLDAYAKTKTTNVTPVSMDITKQLLMLPHVLFVPPQSLTVLDVVVKMYVIPVTLDTSSTVIKQLA